MVGLLVVDWKLVATPLPPLLPNGGLDPAPPPSVTDVADPAPPPSCPSSPSITDILNLESFANAAGIDNVPPLPPAPPVFPELPPCPPFAVMVYNVPSTSRVTDALPPFAPSLSLSAPPPPPAVMMISIPITSPSVGSGVETTALPDPERVCSFNVIALPGISNSTCLPPTNVLPSTTYALGG